MSRETLLENINNHFKAVELCLLNNLHMPALILIYSGIDIFASLGRPGGKIRTTRSDYIGWCDKYLLLDGKIPCSGTDLYAARCGIVHTYTMESSLSDEGKAIEILYSWGNKKPDELQAVIENTGFTQRVVHIETLADAFREGVLKFFSELDADTEKANLVYSRSGKFFQNRPDEFWLNPSKKGVKSALDS